MTNLNPKTLVTVCDRCFRACCLQGQFMCDDAYYAGTTKKCVEELRAKHYGEHESYWEAEAGQ